ncbi:hypothetical protein [Microvirga aerophila]|uniref:Uncharacterized protein n=1 Tax=Microvirga aerophila TaxID=670291 RepID=A0A512BZY7_9HYPH|nr:hypothetical protein [Microvirga aerophila]GEO17500.1 hypothetical protein MAE02_51960 [Microvirga aerophila]
MSHGTLINELSADNYTIPQISLQAGRMTEKLPEVLLPNLKIVFCGTAAGNRSAASGAYYAQPGNRF